MSQQFTIEIQKIDYVQQKITALTTYGNMKLLRAYDIRDMGENFYEYILLSSYKELLGSEKMNVLSRINYDYLIGVKKHFTLEDLNRMNDLRRDEPFVNDIKAIIVEVLDEMGIR